MKGCRDEIWPTCIHVYTQLALIIGTGIQFDGMLLEKAFHILIIFYHLHVHIHVHAVHFSVVQITYTVHVRFIRVLRTLSVINYRELFHGMSMAMWSCSSHQCYLQEPATSRVSNYSLIPRPSSLCVYTYANINLHACSHTNIDLHVHTHANIDCLFLSSRYPQGGEEARHKLCACHDGLGFPQWTLLPCVSQNWEGSNTHHISTFPA